MDVRFGFLEAAGLVGAQEVWSVVRTNHSSSRMTTRAPGAKIGGGGAERERRRATVPGGRACLSPNRRGERLTAW